MQARDIIIAIWLKAKDWDEMYSIIKNKVKFDFAKQLEGIDTSEYVTIVDPDYPDILKGDFITAKHPFVLPRKDSQGFSIFD